MNAYDKAHKDGYDYVKSFVSFEYEEAKAYAEEIRKTGKLAKVVKRVVPGRIASRTSCIVMAK